jgi:hypothetical protein
MPLHDWTRVPSGLYHDFHQSWATELKRLMNRGILPDGFAAFVEQHSGPVSSDVLALQLHDAEPYRSDGNAAVLAPPKPFIRKTHAEIDAGRANRVAIKHYLGRTVAAIELVSPGNKDSREAFREFLKKSREFLDAGVHLLIVDPFPPGPRDPHGIAKAVWEEFGDDDFPMTRARDRTLVSFRRGFEVAVFYESVGIGDRMTAMPLYLMEDLFIYVPLQEAYDGAWEETAPALRRLVETVTAGEK